LLTFYRCLTWITCRDLTSSLRHLRKWNVNRKLKDTALAVKSVVKFQLAGAKHRRSILIAARHARELEKEGISWRLTSEEIYHEVQLSRSKNSSKMRENLLVLEAQDREQIATISAQKHDITTSVLV
jgi:aspartokinase